MNSIEQLKKPLDSLQLFYGKPILFGDICLIHVPTLGDIAATGLFNFFQHLSLLTMGKDQFPKVEENISEIIYLLGSTLIDDQVESLVRKAFLFFIRESVVFLPELKAIHVGEDLTEERFLTEENFPYFQKYIRQICYFEEDPNKEKEGDSDMVKKIKAKIRQGAQEVAKYKKRGKNDEAPELIDLISAFLLRGGGVDIHTIWDMPYYAFQMQFKRLQMAEEYESNMRAALAGAKIPKDKMKYWIRKIQT